MESSMNRFTGRRLIGLVFGLGLFLGILSPGIALGDQPMHTLAQVVDTDGVQNKSVGEIWTTFEKLEPYTLTISIILVIALLFAGGLLKPGGFAKAGLRDLSTLPAVVFIFACFVILLAQVSGAQFVAQIPWVHQQEFTDFQMSVINSSASYFFAIVAGLGMLYILKRSAATGEGEIKSGMGLSPLDFPVGLGCFLLAFPFIRLMQIGGVFAYTQTQGQPPSGMGHETLETLVNDPSNPWVIALVAGAVIGAPIVEELIFRVFLQGALLKWLKSPWLSIIVTSILFASIHRLNTVPVPWHSMPVLFAVGLTCGVAYERTRRVGVPIAMHMLFNMFNVMMVLIIDADASQAGV